MSNLLQLKHNKNCSFQLQYYGPPYQHCNSSHRIGLYIYISFCICNVTNQQTSLCCRKDPIVSNYNFNYNNCIGSCTNYGPLLIHKGENERERRRRQEVPAIVADYHSVVYCLLNDIVVGVGIPSSFIDFEFTHTDCCFFFLPFLEMKINENGEKINEKTNKKLNNKKRLHLIH